jgi:hypothetical protein
MKPKHAEECAGLITLWDAGIPIRTIEMGGLGIAYEQAIQSMAIEFTRAHVDADMPEDKEKLWALYDETCHAVMLKFDDELGGVTGAMFSAGRNLRPTRTGVGQRGTR